MKVLQIFAENNNIVTDPTPNKYISGAGDELTTDIKTIVTWVIGVLGLVAVIVVIMGGFYYMTSNGDAAKVKKGKDTILYGVIGLIIAVLAYAIVNFALGSLTAQ